MMMIAGVALVLAVVAGIVHVTLTWMERRGWVYYRTKDRPRPRSIGALEEIYQPSVTHVIDQETSEDTEAESDERGEAS